MNGTIDISKISKGLIIFVDGEKGGTGKTTVAKSLADFASEHLAAKVISVEADVSSGNFKKVFPECETVKFSLHKKERCQADLLLDLVEIDENCVVIVNMPANSWEAFKSWLESHNLIGASKGGEEFQILQLFVTDGSEPSMSMFERSVIELGNDPRHVLIQNDGTLNRRDWNEAGTADLENLFAEFEIPKFQFPELAEETIEQVEKESFSFGAFAPDKEDERVRTSMNAGHRRRVRAFRTKYIQHVFMPMFAWYLGEETCSSNGMSQSTQQELATVGTTPQAE